MKDIYKEYLLAKMKYETHQLDMNKKGSKNKLFNMIYNGLEFLEKDNSESNTKIIKYLKKEIDSMRNQNSKEDITTRNKQPDTLITKISEIIVKKQLYSELFQIFKNSNITIGRGADILFELNLAGIICQESKTVLTKEKSLIPHCIEILKQKLNQQEIQDSQTILVHDDLK